MTRPHAPLIGHAADALEEALRFSGPADQVVSRHFRAHRELGQRDRAFVAEAVFAVLRRKRSLEAACGGSRRPRDLVLAALVRLQGVSVRSLDAIIDEREREMLGRAKAFDPDTEPQAVRAELPDWLWDRLALEYGTEEAFALACGMLAPAPMDLRVNTLKAARDEVIARLRADGIACAATPYSPFGVRLDSKPQINRHPLYEDGSIEVQDEGSQLLACLVAPRRGEMVVDFCAGAGGKTLALGAIMKNAGRLYAWDVSPKRLAGLDPRLARSGLSNVHPVAIANENDPRAKRLAGKIGRVLVDAPCSGFGTLRRNPDLKWRFGEKDVAELAVKQARILAGAARLLKPGARLVYATCSVLREEGEAVAESFLAAHPQCAAVSCAEILAAQRIPLDTGPYLRLFTHRHHCDGFFAAAFERAA
ncbi:MAG: RsmB/NOP family class I SAM-dependent RNA methyltransferase [Betaproteobacteria bacterium]|nr:RsmB/NOP family class I SAM-dependent RNA methyltransferase [Betaproteobacteria bacterium]